MLGVTLKLSLSIALIFWLLKSGKLDFALTFTFFREHIPTALSFFFFYSICSALGALRWKMLLQSQGPEKYSFIPILKTHWIGLFFNSILPGAVTGDLIKLAYKKHINSTLSKAFFLGTIFLDRLIGLLSLITLMGLFSLINYTEITATSSHLKNIVHFNFFIFLGAIFLTTLLLLPKKVQTFFLNLFSKVPIIGNKASHFFEQIWVIGSKRILFLNCLLLSVVIQVITIFLFWKVISPLTNQTFPLYQAFIVAPLGFISMALPLAPSGLGVGHAIFGTLLSFFQIKQGASLFNVYFICVVFFNLTGSIPYIVSSLKVKSQKNDLKELKPTHET